MLSTRPISLNADIDIPAHSILNAKTPGRKAFKASRGALQENAIHSGAKTVLSKKNILQTPFRPGTTHGKKPLVSVSVSRPLMDKTPFPNRVAAANFGAAGKTPGIKLSKLALLAPAPESLSPDVAPLLRPSSTRKSLRGRLSGNFKTPLTKGNYWDVSPGDIEGIGGVVQEAKEEVAATADAEDDEIEFMPPSAIERPYEPLFEMPDYKTMGRKLFDLGHGGATDDTADIYYAADIHEQIDVKKLLADSGLEPGSPRSDRLELPELEDDNPFIRKPIKSVPGPLETKAIPSLTRATSTRTVAPARTQPPPRPATVTAPTQSRSSSRVVQPPAARIPVPAPAQTRISALRAAKAAASSNSATTPNPVRPASAGTRPIAAAPAKKLAINASAMTSARPLARAASTTAAVRPRPTTGTAGKLKPVNGVAPAKGKTDEDPLAIMLEKTHADSAMDDFLFDV